MSISALLKAGCPVVTLPPGTYPAETVTFKAPDADWLRVSAEGCTFQGLLLKRCANLSIRGGTYTGNLSIDESTGISVREFTLEESTLRILNRSRDIHARWFAAHGGWTGVAGPGRVDDTYTSTGITLEDFVIEGQQSDGIQIGDWHDVTLRRGLIHDVHDPAGVVHNDCVQLTGGIQNLTIEHVMGVGASAFLMAQPQIRPITGLTVRECMGVDQWSVSVQCQGIPGAVFDRCVFTGANGGLWLRKGGKFSVAATDTEVTACALSSLREMDGCRAAVNDRNAVG